MNELMARSIVLRDTLHRIAYATDASTYRELPEGVAYPESESDILELIRYAKEHGASLIPRAGGTSIAGQVVGRGIVVDISRHFNKILEINPEEKWVRVQPGVVRDELNIALKPYGLFFSPETSTSNRCCIGGMVGNNSCGTHSLVYGSTRDHVLQIKGYLSNGTYFDTSHRGSGELENEIYSQLETWRADAKISKLIEENFPDRNLRRRSCGYAIDEALDGLDLCKLICGSEGTLCFITEIKLSLDPLPFSEKMALCAHCNSLENSFLANLIALRHNPVAVELMDGRILELSKGNIDARRNCFFISGNPAALLISEFNGPEMQENADALERELSASGLTYTCTKVYGSDVSKVWALRKAGLGILSGMKGDAKPVGVIEDTAVAPERLPAYMKDFREMLQRLDIRGCVFYGHISTGELHLRPILNIKMEEGRRQFRMVAEQTAKLVKRHKGSLSGEHGDGRLRGEFIPLMYGEECYELMRRVKKTWDPDGIFNPGKIVDAPGMDEWLRFNVNQRYAIEGTTTYFNWKAAFDECKVEGASGVRSQAHAFMSSIEQCNGAGECRKSNLIGGTLCPAFKHSHDELKSTRARANVLRESLTFGKGFCSPEIKEILASCLACKGCRSECPSNVDMTRIRAEVLQHIYDKEGTPLRAWMVARMPLIERLGHAVRPLYNLCASNRVTSSLIKRIVGFAPQRSIPLLSRHTMRDIVFSGSAAKGKVYLFADEFTNYQEAELGLTFANLLTRLGYSVEIPRHLQSGRAAISKGCLKLAKRYAAKNVTLLKDIVSAQRPLVGIEPSCILSFRDEYPDLVPERMRKDAIELSGNCLLYDEFLLNEIKAGRITSANFTEGVREIWLHGHCHQKALVGVDKTAQVLRTIPGADVHVIPSGCCGMAGSFGYEKEHYRTSMEIGEMVLFPAVRKAALKPDVIVAAPGTSCRQQILDGTGIKAVHPIEVLFRSLK